MHEHSGNYEEAEKLLLKARDMKPNDSTVYTGLAAFYNRQGEFEQDDGRAQGARQKEPNNPEAFYTIATFYWEKAYKDFTTTQADKVKFTKQGLEAVDKALSLNKEYTDALIYKGLLLRVQAQTRKGSEGPAGADQGSRRLYRARHGRPEQAAGLGRRVTASLTPDTRPSLD